VSYLRARIPTGCNLLDGFLEGGLPPESITLVYGEAETGKTTFAMQCAVNTARSDCKTIFIDSDNTFAPERLSQIASIDLEDVSACIILIRPDSFGEQGTVIDGLEKYITEKFGLVAVDTVTSLYRSELGTAEESFALNRELNRQVATLAQLSKARGISILLTSQVRSVPAAGITEVTPLATRVLDFWADYVVSLKRTSETNVILATLEKPPRRGSRFRLLLGEEGIHDCVR